jgi:hypothetical protein
VRKDGALFTGAGMGSPGSWLFILGNQERRQEMWQKCRWFGRSKGEGSGNPLVIAPVLLPGPVYPLRKICAKQLL